MNPMVAIKIFQGILSLTALETSGELDLLKSDVAAVKAKLLALITKPDGTVPTLEELTAAIAAARVGFESAIGDGA